MGFVGLQFHMDLGLTNLEVSSLLLLGVVSCTYNGAGGVWFWIFRFLWGLVAVVHQTCRWISLLGVFSWIVLGGVVGVGIRTLRMCYLRFDV